MDHSFLLPVILSFVTLLIVLGIGVWQLKRVRNSQVRRGEHPGGVAGPNSRTGGRGAVPSTR